MNNHNELSTVITLGSDINVIVITGGPCSGKSTSLQKIWQLLEGRGHKVLVCPEIATKLITGGVRPWEIRSEVFQRQILLDTLMQEERFIEAAKEYRSMGRKVVILCDRGAMDGRAYVKEEEFAALCSGLKLTYNDICNLRYHAVIHLRTAALGAEQFYTLANNTARIEPIEVARALDQRTLEAWQEHHHLRVIDNSTDMQGKIQRLFAEICTVIGDPLPIEREEKFLIEPLNPSQLPCKVEEVEIVQDYLLPANPTCRRTGCRACKIPCFRQHRATHTGNTSDDSPNGEGQLPHESLGERRIRARKCKSGVNYFYTVKYELSPGKRIEIERMIDHKEYNELLRAKDPSLQTIHKKRLCFFYNDQPIEVDLYDGLQTGGGNTLAVMEIESSYEVEPTLPPFVKVVKKVTGDKAYSNRALADTR